MRKIQGQCLCGAVRYHSDAVPLMTAICQCKHCQRQTGTTFSILVAVPRGSLVFDGVEPDTYRDLGESGLPIARRLCSRCGSPIFSAPDSMPGMDFIKAGTLDDTSWLRPELAVWCDTAQPWLQLPADLPKLPRNPPAG